MGHFLGNVIYPVARFVESASIRLGYGEFEVADGFKCLDCHDNPSSPPCLQCRTFWVREVGNTDYSDAFERRINIALGTSCLLLAASSWLLNTGLGWWEYGPLMDSVTAFLLAHTPGFNTIPTIWKGVYFAIVGYVFVLATTGVWVGFMIGAFMFGMNPNSKRHYRHMTPSAIVTMSVWMVVYVYFMLQGFCMLDAMLILVPAFTGILVLSLVLCMKKPEENGYESGVVKLV